MSTCMWKEPLAVTDPQRISSFHLDWAFVLVVQPTTLLFYFTLCHQLHFQAQQVAVLIKNNNNVDKSNVTFQAQWQTKLVIRRWSQWSI